MGSNPPGRAKKPQDAIRRPVAFSAPGRMRTPESCESHTERQQDTAKKKEKKECCSHRNFGRLFSEGKLPADSRYPPEIGLPRHRVAFFFGAGNTRKRTPVCCEVYIKRSIDEQSGKDSTVTKTLPAGSARALYSRFMH